MNFDNVESPYVQKAGSSAHPEVLEARYEYICLVESKYRTDVEEMWAQRLYGLLVGIGFAVEPPDARIHVGTDSSREAEITEKYADIFRRVSRVVTHDV